MGSFVLFVGLAVVAFATVSVGRARVRRNTRPRGGRPAYREDLVLPVDPDVAAERCRAALATVGTLRPDQDNAIEATTRMSLRSTGTVVRIELAEGPTGTTAHITAWPGGQLFDWGESRRVVTRVAAGLRGV